MLNNFDQVCDAVAEGGSLPDICKLYNVPYNRVVRWIYDDETRRGLYNNAIMAREEWFAQTLISELKSIAMSNISDAYDANGHLLPPDEWPDNIKKNVAALETGVLSDGSEVKRLKLWDKLKAIELLGKHIRMFKEQIEHTGTISLEDLVTGSIPNSNDTHLSISDETKALPGS